MERSAETGMRTKVHEVGYVVTTAPIAELEVVEGVELRSRDPASPLYCRCQALHKWLCGCV
jgi:hypothetical protein